MSERRARVKVRKAAATRAEACAEFERKKTRLRRQLVKRRIMMGAGAMMVGYAVLSFGWAAHTGRLQESLARAQMQVWSATAQLGFRVDQVLLVGRVHASNEDIKKALSITQGSPIFAYSLAELKQQMEAIPEIDHVQISRVLPNQLVVTMKERVPVALWQKDGLQQLVDVKGVVLAREKYPHTRALPVVVGVDAPKHVGQLTAMLEATPSLKTDVVAAVRVGGRRWNVQLNNEITVMLPEEKPDEAWKRFAKLVEKEALFSKAIRSVDLRMEDRVFIMPLEQDKNPVTLTSARET
jgi:cell division protein FtsQ